MVARIAADAPDSATPMRRVVAVASYLALLGSVALGLQHASDALWLFWLESAAVVLLLVARSIRDRHGGYAALATMLAFFTAIHAGFLAAVAPPPTGADTALLAALAAALALTHAPVVLVRDAIPRLRGLGGRVFTLHIALILAHILARALPGSIAIVAILTLLRLWSDIAPNTIPRTLAPKEFDQEVRANWRPGGFTLEFDPKGSEGRRTR